MSPRAEWTAEPCRNCGDASPGRYCPECGQRKGEVRVSLRRMLADVLEDQLSINATLPRTLIALLFRPGRLTAEYLNGRIASYVPPFRLYLAASVLFFLALSIGSRTEGLQAAFSVEVDTAADAVTAEGAGAVLGGVIDSVRAAVPPGGPARGEPGSVSILGIAIRPQQAGESLPWTERLDVDTGIPQLDRVIVARVRELGALPAQAAARRIGGAMLDRIPTAMFVLLPVFALLLKLLYIRHRRFYVEHFAFALHYHAFAFLSFTLMLALQGTPVAGLLTFWMGAYLWLALKRVHGQPWHVTTVKWILLSWAYLFVLAIGLLTTAVVAVLML